MITHEERELRRLPIHGPSLGILERPGAHNEYWAVIGVENPLHDSAF
jgi:hypothetical protein